ncbi:6-phosphogluconolactonase [Marinobacter daepoensis]|nr:6-phosphogluconolactonase [Marinobacter daepoensis]
MKMPDLPLPDGVSLHVDRSAEQIARALAARVAAVLARRLAHSAGASLVVSGGATPLPFFRALSGHSLDWKRVTVLLADERWVPEDDAASNTALVKRHLLVGNAAEARYLPLKVSAETPDQGLKAVHEQLSELVLPLDVVVLGMGNDGHTASLFPDASELPSAMAPENDALVVAMSPASQPNRRITLTRSVLARARYTALHLRGDDKLGTLREACSDLPNVFAMPVRAFLKPGLEVFWSP